MATQTTEQQNALKDAMERAKQIAAKLQQSGGAAPPQDNTMSNKVQNQIQEENRKRSFRESLALMNSEQSVKRQAMDNLGVDHTDPKVIAQQVANSLVQRAGLGSMLVEEVTVPNKLVGLVIGRGGEMINKLQSESGAKIQVAPDPPPDVVHMYPDRQITITGVSEAVEKAKRLIDEIRVEGKLMGGGMPGEYAVEMSIAAGKVGLVIGKGGETIKSLQERAGCKMVLFQDGEFQHSPEKPLRISGEQSKVMYGKQLVEDLLVSKELEAIHPEKNERHDDGGGDYAEVEVPKEAVGFVIGAKGQSINQIQQITGCRIQFKNNNQDDMQGDFKIATLTGNPQQVAHAKQKLDEILQSHAERRGGRGGNWQGPPRGQRNNWGGSQGRQSGGGGGGGGQFGNPGGPRGPPGPPGGPGGPGGPGAGWGGPGPQGPGGPRGGWGGGPGPRGPPSGFGGPMPNGHQHMVIHVPANRCGLVIGKGGETLKFIHSETKVNIDINREIPENSPFRVFHVRGSDEQIENCLKIIRDKVGDQSIQAKPSDENGQEQPSGPNQPPGWTGSPPQNQQWGPNNQQWGGGPPQGPPGWGQPPQDQWNQPGWNPQGGPWNQQQGGPWNQQPAQPQWDPQQQQWQQPQPQPQQAPWAAQWGQQPQPFPGQPAPAAPATSTETAPATASADPQTTAAAAAAGGQQQQDYSAAWALYYQQQQQYYQQYAMQQQQAQPPAAAPTSTDSSQTATTPTSSNAAQSQAMADYQAKLAEYYKSFGQQPPQQ